jgi:hypothetical protein
MQREEVLLQSQRAYDQWKSLWQYNSSTVKNSPNKVPMSALRNQGLGKQLVIVSMGGSFEKQVDVLKKYQHLVDIMAVDKAFVPLMERGIRPDFVLIADAQTSFPCYLEPFLKESKDIILLSNVNAQPDWHMNWKGIKTFYVNKDNIESEKEFSAISGIQDQIHAGSNVSNAALIYANSVLNYDKYVLLGFDFCWDVGGKFYSFSKGTEKLGNKSVALNNMRVLDRKYDMVNCSENLWFSARWLDMYIRTECFSKVVNASDGILEVPPVVSLEKHLAGIKQYKRNLTDSETQSLAKITHTINSKQTFEQALQILNSKDMQVMGGHVEYIDLRTVKEIQSGRESKYPELKS